MVLVEVYIEDDRGKIFASCSQIPKDGMVIFLIHKVKKI